MNRRIAFALILALLAQSFAPSVALALRSAGTAPQTLLICTGDGIKRIVLEPDAGDAPPQVAHSCPCGVLCAGCGLPSCDRTVARVIYVRTVGFALPDTAVIAVATRAPPRHQVRAPPSST
jgi:hypothetical protein